LSCFVKKLHQFRWMENSPNCPRNNSVLLTDFSSLLSAVTLED
jgi:hypothetical protein